MPLIKWNEQTLSVGIELIDNQHKMLIHLINKLADAIVNHQTEQVITSIFSQLQDYTEYHFNTEEAYFFRLNDEDTALHQAQHNEFILKLADFKQQSPELSAISQQLLTFLSNWLINHIQIEDRKILNQNLC